MATFFELANRVQLVCDKEHKLVTPIIKFLRESENDFIERTNCTEAISTIDTEADYTYTIVSATILTKTFTFLSETDITALFAADITFVVEDSTGNDGDFTVVSSSFYYFVDDVTITDGGLTYSAGDLVFSGGNPTVAATGTYTVDGSGTIDAITITNPGSGYTSAPTVTPSDAGDGNAELTVVTDSLMAIVVSEDISDATADGNIIIDVQSKYDLPSDFVKEFRVEFDGRKLDPLPQSVALSIHKSDGETEYTGYPYEYWITEGKIRLLLKSTKHGILKIWYCYKNTEADSTSPVIPIAEHIKLIDYAIASVLELKEQENRAIHYLNKYQGHIINTAIKYKSQRMRQVRIIDVTDGINSGLENY